VIKAKRILLCVLRDILVCTAAIALSCAFLAIYVRYRARTAENVIQDYRTLITNGASPQQIEAFYSKYKQLEHDGYLVINSPQIPLLPSVVNGKCEAIRTGDSIPSLLLRHLATKYASIAGFSCYTILVSASASPKGEVTGKFNYEPLFYPDYSLVRETVPYPAHWLPYSICPKSLGKWGDSGVRIYSNTPPEVTSRIAKINKACLREYAGCTFSEFFPGAANQLALDSARGLTSCHRGEHPIPD
jgi:hypothetical protein